MSEFAFELSLCAALEERREAVVARQLGGGVAAPGGRVLDAVVVEPGPAFAERAAIAAERIPRGAIEADVGPGRFRPVTDAIDARPERARSVAERAAEVGFFELDRQSGSLCARQVARYPADWFEGIVAIENKPDLGRPGALYDQLRTDVGLAVADRVVLATESHVTGAHLNRLPDSVGVWRFHREGGDGNDGCDGDAAGDGDDAEIEVVREPTQLDVDDYGVELLERHPGRAEIEVVSPAAKAHTRLRIAERAYGKGWRPDAFPACSKAERADCHGSDCLPYCRWAERVVDPATACGSDCDGFEPAEAPAIDPDAERAARTPWVADPDGRQRRQAGLDRFG